MSNITSDNNLDLNLCIIFTTYYIVIISENQKLARREFLDNFNQKSIREFLVNFQTEDYKVSTGFLYIEFVVRTVAKVVVV